MARCPSPRAAVAAVVALPLLALGGAAPATAALLPPSDPMLGDQWALSSDDALRAKEAWRASQGDGVVVAVLDSGVDLSHPELAGALWQNPGERAGNGIDDDADGFIDDVHGADLVGRDGDPSDREGHGTHVAATIAARPHNGGIVGLAPRARIMAVRVLDERRSGDARDVAAGIRYALRHGADVINTSINGDVPTAELNEAVRLAGQAGVPVVASAGNDGRDLDARPSFPASLSEPAVVAVAATGPGGALAPFSNFGARTVDLAAPGTDVLSARLGGGHEWRSGTSMAAPHVAATLALLRSARPDLGVEALRAALERGAAPAGARAARVPAGRLSAAGALRTVLPAEAFAPPKPLLVGSVGRRARLTPRTQVRWSLNAEPLRVARIDVRDTRGRLLARRSAGVRSTWVRRTRGYVRVIAVSPRGAVLARVSVRLDGARGARRTTRTRRPR